MVELSASSERRLDEDAMRALWHFYLYFFETNWRFLHTIVGMLALFSWFVAPAIGGIAAYCQSENRANRSWAGLFRYLFPRDALRQPSCRLDIFHQVTKLLFRPLSHASFLIGAPAVATWVFAGLSAIWGSTIPQQLSLLPWLLTVVAYVLILDAANFHIHYFQHKIKLLWELHKIHHSTEWLLLMLSNRRAHPLEEISEDFLSGVLVGTSIATICYLFRLDVNEALVTSTRAYLILNALSFYHLRHSHIKLGYGWLERYVLSPSQHHIHHACETHLWDKNFGWLLSIWDRMYGTLVYSKDARVFAIGLPVADRHNYDTAIKLLTMPVVNIARMTAKATRNGAAFVTRRLGFIPARRSRFVVTSSELS